MNKTLGHSAPPLSQHPAFKLNQVQSETLKDPQKQSLMITDTLDTCYSLDALQATIEKSKKSRELQIPKDLLSVVAIKDTFEQAKKLLRAHFNSSYELFNYEMELIGLKDRLVRKIENLTTEDITVNIAHKYLYYQVIIQTVHSHDPQLLLHFLRSIQIYSQLATQYRFSLDLHAATSLFLYEREHSAFNRYERTVSIFYQSKSFILSLALVSLIGDYQVIEGELEIDNLFDASHAGKMVQLKANLKREHSIALKEIESYALGIKNLSSKRTLIESALIKTLGLNFSLYGLALKTDSLRLISCLNKKNISLREASAETRNTFFIEHLDLHFDATQLINQFNERVLYHGYPTFDNKVLAKDMVSRQLRKVQYIKPKDLKEHFSDVSIKELKKRMSAYTGWSLALFDRAFDLLKQHTMDGWNSDDLINSLALLDSRTYMPYDTDLSASLLNSDEVKALCADLSRSMSAESHHVIDDWSKVVMVSKADILKLKLIHLQKDHPDTPDIIAKIYRYVRSFIDLHQGKALLDRRIFAQLSRIVEVSLLDLVIASDRSYFDDVWIMNFLSAINDCDFFFEVLRKTHLLREHFLKEHHAHKMPHLIIRSEELLDTISKNATSKQEELSTNTHDIEDSISINRWQCSMISCVIESKKPAFQWTIQQKHEKTCGEFLISLIKIPLHLSLVAKILSAYPAHEDASATLDYLFNHLFHQEPTQFKKNLLALKHSFAIPNGFFRHPLIAQLFFKFSPDQLSNGMERRELFCHWLYNIDYKPYHVELISLSSEKQNPMHILLNHLSSIAAKKTAIMWAKKIILLDAINEKIDSRSPKLSSLKQSIMQTQNFSDLKLEGEHALNWFLLERCYDASRLLLNHGAVLPEKLEETPIDHWLLTYCPNIDDVLYFLKNAYDTHPSLKINDRSPTAFDQAILLENKDLNRFFIEHKAPCSEDKSIKLLLLQIAANQSHLLLKDFLECLSKKDHCLTPFLASLSKNSLTGLPLLAWRASLFPDRFQQMEILLSNKELSLKDCDEDGHTALHLAVQSNSIGLVSLLMPHITPDLVLRKNKAQRSCWDLALTLKDPSCRRLLRKFVPGLFKNILNWIKKALSFLFYPLRKSSSDSKKLLQPHPNPHFSAEEKLQQEVNSRKSMTTDDKDLNIKSSSLVLFNKKIGGEKDLDSLTGHRRIMT